jgi:hypothetical protein
MNIEVCNGSAAAAPLHCTASADTNAGTVETVLQKEALVVLQQALQHNLRMTLPNNVV